MSSDEQVKYNIILKLINKILVNTIFVNYGFCIKNKQKITTKKINNIRTSITTNNYIIHFIDNINIYL